MIDHETAERIASGAEPSRADHSGDRPVLESPLLAGPDLPEVVGSSSIGGYLRHQRALRGISIDELSSITRIPLRSLQRLESGEFDGEADGFVRGFVRTVATAIGLDADDTISRMLKEPAVGVWERHQSRRRLKQVFAAVVLVVIGLISFLVMQAGWRLLVGSSAEDPGREIVVWRDPVRLLAEASGAEVDPAGEIDPAQGTRLETLHTPSSATSLPGVVALEP
ncbi:MAG: hypothetical protein GY910_11120 [bacterium]|nr:hypothetical protein [Deltaproteobacteria bacterium]MCP4905520.1 hypothetical protein [bacterium]